MVVPIGNTLFIVSSPFQFRIQPDSFRLLPCLPEAWPAGRLAGVRCRGGFEVDLEWRGGKLVSVNVTSLRGGQCRVEYAGHVAALAFQQAERIRLDSELERE